tara:strand:- start:349 stop:1056 length:708 start_codon:yes stop_codon:yes gene_type:complete
MCCEIYEDKKYISLPINNLIGKDINIITIINGSSITNYKEYINNFLKNDYELPYYSDNLDEGIHEFGIITFYTKDNYFVKLLFAHYHNGYYPEEFMYYTDLDTPDIDEIKDLGKLINYNMYNIDINYIVGKPHIILNFENYNLIIDTYDNENVLFNIIGDFNYLLNSKNNDFLYQINNNILFDIKNNRIEIYKSSNKSYNFLLERGEGLIFKFQINKCNDKTLNFYSLYYLEKLN